MLSHVGHVILGMNTVQLYMKVACVYSGVENTKMLFFLLFNSYFSVYFEFRSLQN